MGLILADFGTNVFALPLGRAAPGCSGWRLRKIIIFQDTYLVPSAHRLSVMYLDRLPGCPLIPAVRPCASPSRTTRLVQCPHALRTSRMLLNRSLTKVSQPVLWCSSFKHT